MEIIVFSGARILKQAEVTYGFITVIYIAMNKITGPLSCIQTNVKGKLQTELQAFGGEGRKKA